MDLGPCGEVIPGDAGGDASRDDSGDGPDGPEVSADAGVGDSAADGPDGGD